MPLGVSRRTGQLFCRMSPAWGLCDVFLIIGLGVHSGRETAGVKGHVHYLPPGICAFTYCVTAGIDRDPGGGWSVVLP